MMISSPFINTKLLIITLCQLLFADILWALFVFNVDLWLIRITLFNTIGNIIDTTKKDIPMNCRKYLVIFLSLCVISRAHCGLASDNNGTLFSKAESFQHNGRYLEALSFYRDIFLNGDAGAIGADLYKNIGDIYYEFIGDDVHALAMYKILLEKFPRVVCAPLIQHRIAWILLASGKKKEALAQYRNILTANADYSTTHNIKQEMQQVEAGWLFGRESEISIKRLFPRQVRILLVDDADHIEITSQARMELSTPLITSPATITINKACTCKAASENILVEHYGTFKGPLKIAVTGEGCIALNNSEYRGDMWLYARQGKIAVVNHVALEEYLYGVLSREVPSSWPEAALQAQAIAARTYALYHMAKRSAEPYDLFSTTASQVYGGTRQEKQSSRDAVDKTKHLVLAYNHNLALALYHANSGGETTTTENIWGFSLPYLNGRQDDFSSRAPRCNWDTSLSAEDIYAGLRGFGLQTNSVNFIAPLEKDSSGRIKKLVVDSSAQQLYLSGNSFRLIIGPGRVKSSHFDVARNDQTFIFKGTGYGHGAGMSQWGAYEMARNNFSGKQILEFYYPGTELVKAQISAQ
jgi:stage II sporulation protein D